MVEEDLLLVQWENHLRHFFTQCTNEEEEDDKQVTITLNPSWLYQIPANKEKEEDAEEDMEDDKEEDEEEDDKENCLIN